jgi:hypothetical protein
MDSLTRDYPELLRPHESPCLSLYQPTHRRHPDDQQDPIRFRNLLKARSRAPHSGRMDHATGRIRSADLAHPEIDDLLDDLGELKRAAKSWSSPPSGCLCRRASPRSTDTETPAQYCNG